MSQRIAGAGPNGADAFLVTPTAMSYDTMLPSDVVLVDGQGTTEPDPALTARYEEQYRKFRLIYPALKNIFPKIR